MMKPMLWMVAASTASWMVCLAIGRGAFAAEITAGLAGPLAAAVVTWLLIERTFHRTPARVPNVMLQAFAAKMVFFGAYVVILVRVFSMQLAPFAISFTGYFVALYVIQALLLRRLFTPGVNATT